jgi:crotonobetainyl-CoA:carnitine CoA-transferase CaiB-like acyl-CoA transferase
VAPILNVAQAMAHPHLIERNVVRTIHDRGFGELQIPNTPQRFTHYPGRLELHAPYIGEHNAQVLSKYLGYSADKIRSLEEAGILHAEAMPVAAE